ncbi:Hemolymph lipopolysaccharide-binding protein [Blattella germanica]|nr:Hemolymph lipopolysaccharide-binding protein [Blattella germanica]
MQRRVEPYISSPGLGQYNLYNIPVNWGLAWEQCRADGGHLLVLDSQEELNFVRKLIKKRTDSFYTYIGVHDLLNVDHFVTVLDKDFIPSNVNQLRNVENVGFGEKQCLVITPTGRLNALSCEQEHPFICEVETNND